MPKNGGAFCKKSRKIPFVIKNCRVTCGGQVSPIETQRADGLKSPSALIAPLYWREAAMVS